MIYRILHSRLFLLVISMFLLNNNIFPLKLTILRESNNYYRVSILNNSQENVIIPVLFFPEDNNIIFEFIDEKGVKAKFIGVERKIKIGIENILLLKPCESFSTLINISEYYNLHPGIYMVRVVYINNLEEIYGISLWKGKIVSDRISIEVMR